ncbi:MAG: alkaline phosphatase family protein [Verrucomicrobia bacterium]|nr:alkaline phosphatase family protein [Verrucomicrobiota bacterium]
MNTNGIPRLSISFVKLCKPWRPRQGTSLVSIQSLRLSRFVTSLIAISSLFLPLPAKASETKTQNVFLIMSDGLRWQEVFGGAEELLLDTKNGGVKNTNSLYREFWRETPEARRQALLPFFWTEIAKRGQLLGNQKKGSVVNFTNGRKFSYPGYNEVLTGLADPRIDSNAKKLNPNVTVFEWLHGRSGFQGKAAVFATWDVFPYIFNIDRSKLPIWPAWEPRFESPEIQVPETVAALTRDTTQIWEGVIFDSFVFHAALDHLQRKQPRLLFLGFGETDEWAHAGRYDHYLTAAHQVDDFIRRLWETVQLMPQYRNKTTFIITADHGRGSGPSEWKDHGEKIAGAEGIWIATIGPDTSPLGERTNTAAATQSQIAAAISALLGEDYRAAFPRSAPPLEDLLK